MWEVLQDKPLGFFNNKWQEKGEGWTVIEEKQHETFQPNATGGTFSDPDWNNPTVKRHLIDNWGNVTIDWVLDDRKELLSFLLSAMVGIVVMSFKSLYLSGI